MSGGSYIRTRGTGGPTTEDIYASGVSGAKGFTVASRQGTYEVNYDSDFSHNKRFGDIAMGMSKRYGKILDAVKNGNVVAKGEVSDAKYKEWVAQGMVDFEGSENQQQQAYDQANRMVAAQESQQGRKLTLNGEGYD